MNGFENLKSIGGETSNELLGGLADEMKQISETKIVHVQTREVNLVMMASCGCGALPVTIKRTVEHDSPLKDGDPVTKDDLLPTDILG